MVLRSLRRIADAIDGVSRAVGRAVAWVYPVLVLVVVLNVVMRYGFSRGMIELEEVQWHLYSVGFLLAFAYAYQMDDHVRVDVLSSRFSERTRAVIELVGCVGLLIPFLAILSHYSFDFFWRSWLIRETSDMPSGLPARYVIKSVLFAGLFLLMLQAVSVAIRKFLFLVGFEAGSRSPEAR